MKIKLYNRWGIEKEPWLLPDDVFTVDGYDPDHLEKCDVLEKYIEKRLEIYLPNEECSIDLQVNGGLNLALAAAINVFNRLQRSIKVSYFDRNTDMFIGQYLEYQPVFQAINQEIDTFQLIKGRHEHEELNGVPAIYESSAENNGNIPNNQLFNFQALEQIAEEKIKGSHAGTIRLYATGLSQCMVSVIKACRKYKKRLIIMQYNLDTDSYFEQECR